MLGMHKLVTGHGVASGQRPGARLEPGISPKLDLLLGSSTLRIGLGEHPAEAIAALRDDLNQILDELAPREAA